MRRRSASARRDVLERESIASVRNLRVCLGESVRASLRRHPSSSSINHINTSPRARATRRVGNRSILQCGLFLFPSHLNTTNDQHRPFRTHESSMVSHTPRSPTHHHHHHTVRHHTVRHTHHATRHVPRTNERTNRTEPNRTEPNRRRDASLEDARATTDSTRLDSSRGRHPSHSSLDGWWGRDGGENCSLDYSRLRSSERSDDESDAKARREDDQGEI